MNKFSSMFWQILQIFSKRGFPFALFASLVHEWAGWLAQPVY